MRDEAVSDEKRDRQEDYEQEDFTRSQALLGNGRTEALLCALGMKERNGSKREAELR
jgi:hypothetical protein